MTAKDVRLVKITTPEQSKIFRDLITEHHSYVKSVMVGGKQIDYLVFYEEKVIGGIGLGSAPMISGAMLDYFEPILPRLPLIPAKNGNTGRSRLWRAQIHLNPY